MLSREECKQQLLNECQIMEKEGKYLVTNSTSGMVSKNKSRRELKEAIIFHTSKLDFKKDVSFSERIYWIMYNINEIQKCQKEGCNNLVLFCGFNNGYAKYCSIKCGANDEIVKKKHIETNLKIYGAINNSCTTENKAKVKNTWNNKTEEELKDVSDRTHETMLKIDENGLTGYQKSEIKGCKTRLIRYGNPGYRNNEKAKKTVFEKYNVQNISQIPEIKLKKENTTLKNYGFRYSFCNEEILHKAMLNSNSGIHERVENLRYDSLDEKYFIDDWVKENPLNSIKRGPQIKYTFNNQEKLYNIDFEITNKYNEKYLIEIKGRHPWFYKDIESGILLEKYKAAEKFCEQNNYKGYLFIMDKKIITKEEILSIKKR